MALNNYLNQVGELIGKDELPLAIAMLHKLLKNSPKLDEVILQSARYNDITKQIRLGTVDFNQANLGKNQIRYAILDLVQDIEGSVSENPHLEKESSDFVQKWESQYNVVQSHSGKGDVIGRDQIVNKNRKHSGVGDIVEGGKYTWVSIPVRWTIVAGLCASLLTWYLIWGRPDDMPKAAFEYFTEGAKASRLVVVL